MATDVNIDRECQCCRREIDEDEGDLSSYACIPLGVLTLDDVDEATLVCSECAAWYLKVWRARRRPSSAGMVN